MHKFESVTDTKVIWRGEVKFRVLARGVGEDVYSGNNNMRYSTVEEAQAAAKDLYSRWAGCEGVVVIHENVKPDVGGRWSLELAHKENI